MRPAILATALLPLLLAGPVRGQSGPRVVKLRVTAAAVPTPALKYPLLPPVRDLRAGNAAVFYQRSHSPAAISFLNTPEYRQLLEWVESPLDAKTVAKLEFLQTLGALKDLDDGARCEHCSWQMLERARVDGYMMLVADVQDLRTLGALLALRTRLEIRDGTVDRAAHSLQTGLALSRHLGEAPTFINYLVGTALAHTALNRVEELVQLPRAPNLYWSLTDLPAPLLDMRRPLQSERLMADSLFPEVRAALDDPRLPPVPAEVTRARLGRLRRLGIMDPPTGYPALVAQNYPAASRYFLERGRTGEQLEALPVTQVVLMHQLALYEQWMDEYAKLQGLPYWQARPRLQALRDQRQQAERSGEERLLLVWRLLPAMEMLYQARARLERRVALLRCVEALRLHAADHGGALPETLAKVRAVPVPEDPMTGKAFRYRRDGATAVLEPEGRADAHPGDPDVVRYEVTLVAAPGRN